jgi:phosphoglycolate phosphatase
MAARAASNPVLALSQRVRAHPGRTCVAETAERATLPAMSAQPFLFDAVLFDLDGTLVATDRFWVDAARAGARRAFEELGLERAMPTAAQWMAMVGLPLEQAFDALFTDLDPKARAHVFARCVQEETKALSAGQAAMIPGVEAMLNELAARGVRMGVASNCGRSYLDSMMHELGLARWIEEGRCLDSPGIGSKAAMVADLLDVFGTRAAVMVGDRKGDRDAAWQNGVPHVHFARGFAVAGEIVECEATIEDMGALVPRLERRTEWIAGALDRLGFASEGGPRRQDGPRSIGITGHTGSGKTLFARDVQRLLSARGVESAIVALEDFRRAETREQDLTSTAFAPSAKPLDHLGHAFDVERLVAAVVEARSRDDVLVVQGPFLLHPSLRKHLDRVVFLEASDTVCLRRIAGRDARAADPEVLMRMRRSSLPAQRGFDQIVPPRENADIVLDGDNALG